MFIGSKEGELKRNSHDNGKYFWVFRIDGFWIYECDLFSDYALSSV